MMKSAVLSAALVFTPALAMPGKAFTDWAPPGDGDVRGPCPMLNTLANHGYLPHDGQDFTQTNVIDALTTALNFGKDLAIFLHDFALTTNPVENATTWSLDDLTRHDGLEHDASLSRQDAYFGPADVFNAEAFAETQSYWGNGKTISLEQAARARTARVVTSAATNPAFFLSDLGADFIYGENAAFMMVFAEGEWSEGLANREQIEWWFQNERLPEQLGWTRPSSVLTEDVLMTALEKMVNVTALTMIEDAEGNKKQHHVGRRSTTGLRNIHLG